MVLGRVQCVGCVGVCVCVLSKLCGPKCGNWNVWGPVLVRGGKEWALCVSCGVCGGSRGPGRWGPVTGNLKVCGVYVCNCVWSCEKGTGVQMCVTAWCVRGTVCVCMGCVWDCKGLGWGGGGPVRGKVWGTRGPVWGVKSAPTVWGPNRLCGPNVGMCPCVTPMVTNVYVYKM